MKDAVGIILQNRSAFSLFKRKGIDAVNVSFPKSVKFVMQNSEKSLKQVTKELEEALKAHSENFSPA